MEDIVDEIVYISERDKEWHQDVWVTDRSGQKINISCACGKVKSTPSGASEQPRYFPSGSKYMDSL